MAAVAVIVRGGQAGMRRGQVLFIERSVNERDRYSGHMAFPGGRGRHSEPPLQTAIRETFEEVGLRLDDEEHFQLIGRLSPIVRHDLIVHPFGK